MCPELPAVMVHSIVFGKCVRDVASKGSAYHVIMLPLVTLGWMVEPETSSCSWQIGFGKVKSYGSSALKF